MISKPSVLTKSLAPLDKQMKVSEEPLDDSIGRIWLLSAMKGSGKTTIWYNVLHNKVSPWYQLFDKIWMISPTAKGDEKLKPLLDELQEAGQYWDHLSEKIMLEVYDAIAGFNHAFKTETIPQTLQEKRAGLPLILKNKRKPRNLLIFDDCMADMPSSTQKSVINRIFSTSRHWCTNIIVTTQKYSKLSY